MSAIVNPRMRPARRAATGVAEKWLTEGWRANHTVVRFRIEVRVVNHVEHIHGGADLHAFPDLERTRQPRVPDVSRRRPPGIAAHARRTVLEVAISVVVRARSDVVRPSALQGHNVRGLDPQR